MKTRFVITSTIVIIEFVLVAFLCWNSSFIESRVPEAIASTIIAIFIVFWYISIMVWYHLNKKFIFMKLEGDEEVTSDDEKLNKSLK